MAKRKTEPKLTRGEAGVLDILECIASRQACSLYEEEISEEMAQAAAIASDLLFDELPKRRGR
jgi:hypothetical protein